jgi:hypothetical protein
MKQVGAGTSHTLTVVVALGAPGFDFETWVSYLAASSIVRNESA